jgi:Leucine-rich repeat (LRR) protein
MTQKLENAKKTGILSLSEHSLEEIPNQVFDPELAKKLRTLDLSKNKISRLGQLGSLIELKSLNLDNNNLFAGSLEHVSRLSKLQNLSVAGNKLGKPSPSKPAATRQAESLPELPVALKQLNLSSNFFSNVPRSVVSVTLIKLKKLDLSSNQLATVPEEIANIKTLEELRLDSNMIVLLPEAIGRLTKLKVLSLRDNQLEVAGTNDTTNPQPLPKSLFTDTLLIDLNLHGNRRLTNTQLNQFEGYQDFLERRQKVKSKTMTNFDVCGLD